jgi:hypothetical protein
MHIPEGFAEDAKRLTESELERKYGRHPRTIYRWKAKLGIRSERTKEPPPSVEPEIITLKPKVFKPRKYRGSLRPQVQVLCFSDTHAGAITPSYNPGVFRARIRELFDSVVQIKELQTKQHPIEKLVIFALGDMVQGEAVGEQMELDEFYCSVYDQCYKLWLPVMVEFITNLRAHYREIEWYGVKGNHGRGHRWLSSRSSNWDNNAQKALENSLGGFENVKFKIEPVEFYQIVEVLKWKWMILHGDARRVNASPDYLVNRRMAEWEIALGVDGFAMGHWHRTELRYPRQKPVILSGTFKSDDEYSLRYYGSPSAPSQATFGVHPDRPVSWFYRLDFLR